MASKSCFALCKARTHRHTPYIVKTLPLSLLAQAKDQRAFCIGKMLLSFCNTTTTDSHSVASGQWMSFIKHVHSQLSFSQICVRSLWHFKIKQWIEYLTFFFTLIKALKPNPVFTEITWRMSVWLMQRMTFTNPPVWTLCMSTLVLRELVWPLQ